MNDQSVVSNTWLPTRLMRDGWVPRPMTCQAMSHQGNNVGEALTPEAVTTPPTLTPDPILTSPQQSVAAASTQLSPHSNAGQPYVARKMKAIGSTHNRMLLLAVQGLAATRCIQTGDTPLHPTGEPEPPSETLRMLTDLGMARIQH